MNVTTESDYIVAKQGDNVTLTCLYNTMNSSNILVKWLQTTKMENGIPDLINGAKQRWIYESSGLLDKQVNASDNLTSSLIERNSNLPATNGHSIKFKNISLQDEGLYVCQLELDFGSKKGIAYSKINVHSE